MINLFIHNISFDATEESLKAYFADFGDIKSCKIIYDRETGRSRGIGFVEFFNRDEGEAAIRDLNNREFMGRELHVQEARPREERGNGGARQDRWQPAREGGYGTG